MVRRDSGSVRPREGINWGLIGGGAAATILSLAFRRISSKNSSQRSPSASAHAEVSSPNRTKTENSSLSEVHDFEGAEKQIYSPPTSSRDAVWKLRQQLKSRDEMIMEMQIQLADKDRKLFSHQSLIDNLEEQLRMANDSIFQVERVIHDINDCGATVDVQEDGLSSGLTSDGSSNLDSSPSRDEAKTAKPVPLTLQHAKHLEAELLGIRAMACEMASLLEVSERERLRLHHVVSQLQQKLVFQAKELRTMKAMSMADAKDFPWRSKGEQEKSVVRLSESYSSVDSYLQARVHPLDSIDDLSLEEVYQSASFDDNDDNKEEKDALRESSSSSGSWSLQDESVVLSHSGTMPEEHLEQLIADEQYNGFQPVDSPGVMIGSPTIPGSQSVDHGSTIGTRRYLFEADDESLLLSSSTESGDVLLPEDGTAAEVAEAGDAVEATEAGDAVEATEAGDAVEATEAGGANEADVISDAAETVFSAETSEAAVVADMSDADMAAEASEAESLEEMLNDTLNDLVKVSLVL